MDIKKALSNSTKTKDERGRELDSACGGDTKPKQLAERIIESGDSDEFTPIEKWLATNYLSALSVIKMKGLAINASSRVSGMKTASAINYEMIRLIFLDSEPDEVAKELAHIRNFLNSLDQPEDQA